MTMTSALVPLLWVMGWASPWAEITANPIEAAVVTSACTVILMLGAILGFRKYDSTDCVLETPSANLTSILTLTAGVGFFGYLYLAFSVGGPVALLHTLGDRRGLLAGTGASRVLLYVSAAGAVLGLYHRHKSRWQVFLTGLCAFVFVASSLLTGGRFGAALMAVAAIVAACRAGIDTRRLARMTAAVILLAIPLSTLYGLKVRTGLTYGHDVVVVDSSSTQNAIYSLVNPFIQGGLDTIRTTGLAAPSASAYALNLVPSAGSLGNVVPRSLWPNKPDGAATQFSREFLP